MLHSFFRNLSFRGFLVFPLDAGGFVMRFEMGGERARVARLKNYRTEVRIDLCQ
jgi:hypothetical protein